MEDYQSLSHTKWQCKYHIIFIPKYRRRALFGVVRRELGNVFHRLAEQKGCRIEEAHVMSDHVHALTSIPPGWEAFRVDGYLKGKSAIHMARHFLKRERNYSGQNLWARGYFADSVGRKRRCPLDTLSNKKRTPDTNAQ